LELEKPSQVSLPLSLDFGGDYGFDGWMDGCLAIILWIFLTIFAGHLVHTETSPTKRGVRKTPSPVFLGFREPGLWVFPMDGYGFKCPHCKTIKIPNTNSQPKTINILTHNSYNSVGK
jgi:hypothetical protein